MSFLKWLLLIIILAVGGYFAYSYFWPQAYLEISLRAPDVEMPTAEVCDFQAGKIVLTKINVDGPDPSCIKVYRSQSLKVINNTEQEISIGFDNLPVQAVGLRVIKLPPVGEYLTVINFGQYLSPGVHRLRAVPFFGPEIWLVNN